MAKRHISIPVSDDQAEMLGQMAAEQGESLASYVRGRIFAKDSLEAEFHALQSSLLAVIGEGLRQQTNAAVEAPKTASVAAPASTVMDPQMMGLLLEILLLLRTQSNPTKMQAIHAEVARMGFKPYG